MKLDVDKAKEFLRTNLVLIIAAAVMLVLLVVLYVPKLSYLTELKVRFDRRAEDLRGKIVSLAEEANAKWRLKYVPN